MIHIFSSNTKSVYNFPLSDKQSNGYKDIMQPNAIDLRVHRIFRIVPGSEFFIDETSKQHRDSYEIAPDTDGLWNLFPGVYDVVAEGDVGIAEHEAGWVVARSTLIRNGILVSSGLYDSGYKGPVGGVMHVTTGPMKIRRGTRFAQFLLFKAECLSLYDGDYGTNKEHNKKYEGS